MRVLPSVVVFGLFAGALLTAMSSPARAEGPLGEDRKNGLGLYLWATGIDGKFTVMGEEVPVDVSFGELFDQVEIAGSLHYERVARSWGAFADLTYIDMGADFTEPMSQLPGTQEMTFLLAEAGAVRRWGPGENKVYFDLLLGLRYWDLEQAVEIGGNPALDATDSWVDGLVGGRILVPLGEKWWFTGRLDVAAGGSDIAWNTSVLFDWQATRLLSVIFGYRFLHEEHETGSGADLFALDADFGGPVLAVGFRW
jgi:hypothetical protein